MNNMTNHISYRKTDLKFNILLTNWYIFIWSLDIFLNIQKHVFDGTKYTFFVYLNDTNHINYTH